MSNDSRKALVAGGILIVIVLACLFSQNPVDFRVYHVGAAGVFDGTRPVYGETSGLGWPMHYRYPPLFLLLFAPLAFLPLGLGAGIWMAGKCAVLFFVVRAMTRGLGSARGRQEWVIPLLFSASYLVLEFRYGNVQFFIFGLVAAALVLARSRPIWAAGALGLAVAVKVWPLFFIPYLAVRRDWRVIAWTLSFVFLLTMVPAVYFGFSANLDLISQWADQEFRTQLGSAEIGYPNQSLRGTLMRYLTVVDYSEVPDSNYRTVNILSLAPETVRMVWFGMAGAGYMGLLLLAYRRRSEVGWVEHGVAFCGLALLEPFSHKSALVVLLWPAIIAGVILARGHPPSWVRGLVYTAVGLALIQPLVPGSDAQRLLQVLGLDFLAACCLTVGLVWASVSGVRPTVDDQSSAGKSRATSVMA